VNLHKSQTSQVASVPFSNTAKHISIFSSVTLQLKFPRARCSSVTNDDPQLALRDCYPWVRCRGCYGQQTQGCQGARCTMLISQLVLNQPTCLRAIWVQEAPVIVTERNPRGKPCHSHSAQAWLMSHLRRCLIDCSPRQDQRPYRFGLTRPTPPCHHRKDALLNGDIGGPLPNTQAQLQVSRACWHLGASCCQ
jgi:hypothetical protein